MIATQYKIAKRAAHKAKNQAEAKKPDACPLGAASSACAFCEFDLPGAEDRCQTLHGEHPGIAIPGLPESMRVVTCAFPLGHHGAHLLLSPKRHYPSLAQIEPQSDLAAATAVSLKTLQAMFPHHWICVFEHGTGQIDHRAVKCGGCHVDHAHGHMIALDYEVDFEMIRELTEGSLLDLGWDLDKHARQSGEIFSGQDGFVGVNPYLHLGMVGRGQVSFTYKQVEGSANIPSQLLRKLIATAAGNGQPSYWNWKVILEHDIQSRLREFGELVRTFKSDFHAHLRAG